MGYNNEATSSFSTVGGGISNQATAYGATVSGGSINDANNIYATVAGGNDNVAAGLSATVGGGRLPGRRRGSGTGSSALAGAARVPAATIRSAARPVRHVRTALVEMGGGFNMSKIRDAGRIFE